MSDLWTRWQQQRVLIPGGWLLTIPDVQPTPEWLRKLTSEQLQETGGDALAAERKVKRAINAEFARGRIYAVEHSIRYWARRYLTAAPDLARQQGEAIVPLGYDPTRVASWWWPGQIYGRRGKLKARLALQQMIANARLQQ